MYCFFSRRTGGHGFWRESQRDSFTRILVGVLAGAGLSRVRFEDLASVCGAQARHRQVLGGSDSPNYSSFAA